MARSNNAHLLLVFLLAAVAAAAAHGGANGTETTHGFAKRLSPPAKLKEKMSHLHFYFHDVVSGRNRTAVPIVSPPSTAMPWTFGMVTMMDDLLTVGPEPSSAPVGRAQGIYASAAQDELGFLMAMNLAFTAGKYNGSVLTVLGRNCPLHDVREMPIVGGSGLFRFARGYALAHTHYFDTKTGNAIVEYNVYAIHY